MEARCEKFMVDAKRPADAKTAKDIAKLRSFLFKNQNNRFTNGEQEHLFQAVTLYATAAATASTASGGGGGGGGDDDDNPALGLLEDALKMPFTVFTTSHKKAFLRWLDKLQQQQQQAAGGGGGSGAAGAAPAAPRPRHQLIDLSEGAAEVMDPEDGETLTLDLNNCPPDVLEALRRGFEAGLDVRVAVRPAGGGGGGGGAEVCGVECRE